MTLILRSELSLLVLISLLTGLASTAFGQLERYDLGKRLRRFEEAWSVAAEGARRESTPPMEEAVRNFFGLRLAKTAERIDQGWLCLLPEKIPDWQLAAMPNGVKLNAALFDSANPEISATLQPFYSVPDKVPETAVVRFSVKDQNGQAIQKWQIPWRESITPQSLRLESLPPGDYRICAEVADGESAFELLTSSFTVVDKLGERLESLEASYRDKESIENPSVRAMLGDHVALFKGCQTEFVHETDFPIHQMLTLDEQLTVTDCNWKNIVRRAAEQQDLWLTLAEGRRRVPVRLRCPPKTSGPLPVLFLFHGMGGSENMFFETYGAGGAVQAGLERGWLVVAPRQGLTGLPLDIEEMLTELEDFFAIDRSRVFLLGHSMGAGQVIRQAGLHPDLPLAAAAIGGGSAVRDATKIAKLPWFVAAGEMDFGKRGAKAFHASLSRAGGTQLEYLEVPQVEHLVIVQAALKDAFRFFDETLSNAK
ncbi:MAG: hypothetical protein ABL888_09035 [Pirellulaceae bacterium]